MQELYIQAEAFLSSMKQFDGIHCDSSRGKIASLKIKKSLSPGLINIALKIEFGAKLAWRNSNPSASIIGILETTRYLTADQ